MPEDAPNTAAEKSDPPAETPAPEPQAAAPEADAPEAKPKKTEPDAGADDAAAAEAGSEADAAGAKPKKPAPDAEEKEEAEPEFDPETCKAIAIGLEAFLEGMDNGEWDDTEFQYYLEPAGILSGPLACTRAPEDNPQRAGLLMTRAGWKAKKLALDDDVNPDTYELSFPKEFGYVKPLSHYRPATYEHAKYPWSKKY